MTAVEWLVSKILVENEVHTDSDGEWIDKPRTEYVNGYRSYVDLSKYVTEALEMEKKQHDKTAEDWWREGAEYMESGGRGKWKSFEQYYNEKYKAPTD